MHLDDSILQSKTASTLIDVLRKLEQLLNQIVIIVNILMIK